MNTFNSAKVSASARIVFEKMLKDFDSYKDALEADTYNSLREDLISYINEHCDTVPGDSVSEADAIEISNKFGKIEEYLKEYLPAKVIRLPVVGAVVDWKKTAKILSVVLASIVLFSVLLLGANYLNFRLNAAKATIQSLETSNPAEQKWMISSFPGQEIELLLPSSVQSASVYLGKDLKEGEIFIQANNSSGYTVETRNTSGKFTILLHLNKSVKDITPYSSDQIYNFDEPQEELLIFIPAQNSFKGNLNLLTQLPTIFTERIAPPKREQGIYFEKGIKLPKNLKIENNSTFGYAEIFNHRGYFSITLQSTGSAKATVEPKIETELPEVTESQLPIEVTPEISVELIPERPAEDTTPKPKMFTSYNAPKGWEVTVASGEALGFKNDKMTITAGVLEFGIVECEMVNTTSAINEWERVDSYCKDNSGDIFVLSTYSNVNHPVAIYLYSNFDSKLRRGDVQIAQGIASADEFAKSLKVNTEFFKE